MTWTKSNATAMGPAEFSKGSMVHDRNGNLRRVSGQEADMNMMIATILVLVLATWDLAVLCIWPFEAVVRFKFWPPLTNKLIVNPMLGWV
jgi:hypothetical protein